MKKKFNLIFLIFSSPAVTYRAGWLKVSSTAERKGLWGRSRQKDWPTSQLARLPQQRPQRPSKTSMKPSGEPAPKMKDKRVHRYNHRETSAERNYSQTARLWRERLNWYCSWRSVARNDPKPLTFYQAVEFWRDPLQPGLVRFVWQKANQTCRSSNMCFSAMFWEWTSSNTRTQ